MKIICSFISALLFFIISLWGVFADVSIGIQTDWESYDISQLVELRIDIESDESLTGGLEIPWIDDFVVVGQSQRNSNTNLNGKQISRLSFILNLKGKKAWKYTLGPIQFGENIQSNSVDIEITGAEVFIGWQIDTPSSSASEQARDTQEEDTILLNNKILEEYDSKNKDSTLFDLHANSSLFPLHWRNTLFYILIMFGFYALFKWYLHISSKLKIAQDKLQKSVPKPIEYSDYQWLLSQIEKKYIDAPKNGFYWEIASVFRLYLDEKISPGLSSQTLREIRVNLRSYPTIFRLYESVYYPEYNTKTDSLTERQKLLNELQNELI